MFSDYVLFCIEVQCRLAVYHVECDGVNNSEKTNSFKNCKCRDGSYVMYRPYVRFSSEAAVACVCSVCLAMPIIHYSLVRLGLLKESIYIRKAVMEIKRKSVALHNWKLILKCV